MALVDLDTSKGKKVVGQMNDIEHTMRLLLGLKYVDPDKVCLYGHGYGGYMVLTSLLANSESLSRVKCGIAAAPVTDWTLGK